MKSDPIMNHELPIACDPNALTAEQWMKVGTAMYQAVQEIEELPNGYALRLPATSEMLMLIAEDLTMDRLCCPLSFTLEIQPAIGPFWLKMMGSQEAKTFLKMSFELSTLIDERVARSAGFELSGRVELDSVDTAVAVTHNLNERYAKSVQAAQTQEESNGE